MSIEQSLEEISTNAANTVDLLTSLLLVIEQMSANVELLTKMVEDYTRPTPDNADQRVSVSSPQPETTTKFEPADPEPEQVQPDIDPKQANAYLQQVSANLPGGKGTIREIMASLGMSGGLGGATQEQMRGLIIEVDKQVAAAQNSFE